VDIHFLEGFESPSRYIGNELHSVHKVWEDRLRILLVYPDLYEVGMSSHGLRILYHLLNDMDDVVAERAFAPGKDLAQWLRAHGEPLFSLESQQPAPLFDVIAFSLSTELTYTNVLNILDLGTLPVRSEDRTGWPIILAGGSCSFNPEPMAPFIDAFGIGDGEELMPDIVRTLRAARSAGLSRDDALVQLASSVPGIYVPSLYDAQPAASSLYVLSEPRRPSIPRTVAKRTLADFGTAYVPVKPIVPFRELVHDRGTIELFRGCVRGCRFCEAGISYRPMREKPLAAIRSELEQLVANTGYEEVGLLSLSSTDYSDLPGLTSLVRRFREEHHISISFPSLRMENFPDYLADEIKKTREGSLTFAIEAGSQRLRDVINKNITEESIFATLKTVFGKGWHLVKFYFMFGLPGETAEDLDAMVDLVERIQRFGSGFRRDVAINLSINPFVPRPDTPFQWCPQDTMEQSHAKIDHLKTELRKLRGKVHADFGDPRIAFLEGLLSRGDRRIASVIETAWRAGAQFDGWRESFRFDVWMAALHEQNVIPDTYLYREIGAAEPFPWEVIQAGVSREFLRSEYEASLEATTSPTCQQAGCRVCGVQEYLVPCPSAPPASEDH
jgi:radical SAM family uncharacterized protein